MRERTEKERGREREKEKEREREQRAANSLIRISVNWLRSWRVCCRFAEGTENCQELERH